MRESKAMETTRSSWVQAMMKCYSRLLRLVLCVAFPLSCHATGVIPDTTLLVVSEADGVAQMGLRNTENRPLLLYTTIVDLPEDKGPSLFALPTIARVEAGGRQVVRFMLDSSAAPLTVQHLKRVRFEGIPAVAPTSGDQGKVQLTITIRQDLPVVISPKGLEQDPEPWKKLVLKLADGKLRVSNPSPFVIRLSDKVDLLPDPHEVKFFSRTYVLPGESFDVALPKGVAADTVSAVRLFPASPFGYAVSPYDVTLAH